ncbi:DUF6122 family protein [Pseudomonadales bacterium]|nr:DUF6122 family protein [Pseudomonadales bacterium]MDA9297334.1 DUF6122 family protein [Pseudomonadales bacterium]MDA9366170.1 DUF6122 family protein [Pseudomonadales bacterium]MDB4151649.1 DUF6122 family protein [Pseudomonadales bacterium]MDB9918162.1 DUF6122 family protein [Pseudomonadales bacterium]
MGHIGTVVIVHLLLHFLVPLLPALTLYRKKWLVSYGMLLAGLLIDVDHLLADPIYDPGRCSIGFHPLHTAIPIVAYSLLMLFPKTRLIGMGLIIHVVLDAIDCQMTSGIWYTAG